jgi:hypothetical protein
MLKFKMENKIGEKNSFTISKLIIQLLIILLISFT